MVQASIFVFMFMCFIIFFNFIEVIARTNRPQPMSENFFFFDEFIMPFGSLLLNQ
jgi:hypothetical protein